MFSELNFVMRGDREKAVVARLLLPFFPSLESPLPPFIFQFQKPPSWSILLLIFFLWIKRVQGSSNLPGRELSNEGEGIYIQTHTVTNRAMTTLLLGKCTHTGFHFCEFHWNSFAPTKDMFENKPCHLPSGWAQLLCSRQPLSNDMNLFCHYVQNVFSSF